MVVEQPDQWEFPLSNWFDRLLDENPTTQKCGVCGEDIKVECNGGGCDE